MINEPQIIVMGLPLKDFLAKFLKMFGILLLVFYYTYPQALDVMGSSFILPAAFVSISLYTWKRFPFVEVVKVIVAFLLLLFWCLFCEYVNGIADGFRMTYIRSQMAWFFTAYFINFIIFNVHKNPRFEVMVGYIAAAITLQCVITYAMNQNDFANDFFYSLQMKNIYTEEIKEMTEEQRLIGYGTAFFGAGMVAGYGLILITYLISKVKMNLIQLISMAGIYCFVFFIGLFSARTTTIGLGASIGFLFLLFLIDKTSDKKQPLKFIIASIVLFIIGMGLASQLFPEYTDWAFEMFDNYKRTGKFSTKSSDALYVLFYLPPTFQELLTGTTKGMNFWGNDMGFTRLIWYIGFIGTFLYFAYQLFVASLMMTKDLSANLLILTIVGYAILMNIKGFTDLNPVLYLFFFYFLFHKYYRFFPNLYRNRMIELQEKRKRQIQLSNED